jgi:hypothetical protein
MGGLLREEFVKAEVAGSSPLVARCAFFVNKIGLVGLPHDNYFAIFSLDL